MKDEEKAPSQIGIFNIPRSAAHPDDKVLKIFTKLKQRAKENKTLSHSSAQVTPLKEIESNFAELQQSAMNLYRLRSEVIKTD